MKIAYLTPSLYLAGGVERVLTTKVNYLAERLGYEVTVILTDGAGQAPHFPLSPKVKVINLDLGFERMWNRPLWYRIWIYIIGQWRYRRLLRQTLLRLCPDVTVSTLRREINFLCDIPDGSLKVGELHVTRSHYRHFEPTETNAFKRALAARWSRQLLAQLRRLDRMVVLTNDEAARWPEVERLECIPNPLPFSGLTASEMDSRPADVRCKAITVARYSHEKGIDLLVKAWAKVAEHHPLWELNCYGSGDAAPYERLARSLGVASIYFHPSASDIRSRYVEHEFCILPSRFEGFGMAIIEAAACGLPTVAFACDGPRALIADGQTGLLVPCEDTEALARAIIHLIETPQERASMAQAAWEASQNYSLDAVMQRWHRLFETLTSSSRP